MHFSQSALRVLRYEPALSRRRLSLNSQCARSNHFPNERYLNNRFAEHNTEQHVRCFLLLVLSANNVSLRKPNCDNTAAVPQASSL